ncbi:uncharacterized protein LOC116341307 [Contarinia nasturtii]|uniref:uncharacterized protein LOC116341307 n=1 Tax=Contarinia nasturtii TaxID=265458 RepID=UPI0012D47F91|nr:uncharacterized protein LOC116341307 [Contarinia nasturtii]
MRSILFLTLLSPLLFVQAINGEEKRTFSETVNKFYNEVKPMKSKLDFMLQITKNINEIKKNFEVPVSDFINNEARDECLKTFLYDDIRKFYQENDDLFNKRQTEKVNILNTEFCNALESPNKYENFSESIDAKRVKDTDLKAMQTDFTTLQKKFNSYIDNVYKLKASNKADVGSINSLYNNILKTRNSKTKAIMIKRLETTTDRLVSEQTKLIGNIRNAISILLKYNQQRITWTEFLIKMTDSPKSD